MNQRGFTLTELIMVIVIAGILLAIVSMDFTRWTRRSGMEKQVRELYADLMFIRQEAMNTKQTHRAAFSSTNYVFKRYSTEFDVSGNQILSKQLSYPVTRSNWASPSSTEIEFNSKGIMIDPITKCICVFSKFDPTMDSLVITQSRVSIGKINNQGGTCGSSNIDIK
jgi:type IV fimbrial biogenesis protein FimT